MYLNVMVSFVYNYTQIVPESPRYLVLKGQTRKAQSLLAKIARFNCKPSLSARLKSEGTKEVSQLVHFTVSDGEQHITDSDGEQEDTENTETATDSSVPPSLVIVTSHQEKMVISITD